MRAPRASAVVIDAAIVYDLYKELLDPAIDRFVGIVTDIEALLMADLIEVMGNRNTPLPTMSEFLENCSIPTDIRTNFVERFKMIANSLVVEIAHRDGFEDELHTLEIRALRGYRLEVIANRNDWNGPTDWNGSTTTLQELCSKSQQMR